MMFENLEELLKTTDCRVQTASRERWLFWDMEVERWIVNERKRYAKQNKCLYDGNDLREAMQYLK